jgi:predicted hydrocarbon binding protein
MSEQRMVEAARIRGVMDGLTAAAGEKGRDMALRHSGLEQYIENPPAMSETEFVPAEEYVALVQALYDVFGKGSKALLIYAGEEMMRRGMEGMPKFFGSVMKFLPGGLKKQGIFKLMASQAAKTTGLPVTVEFDKGKVTYSDSGCAVCDGRHADEPMCHFESGILLAAAESGTGKKHRVTEVKCKALGDEACVWVIEEVGGDA